MLTFTLGDYSRGVVEGWDLNQGFKVCFNFPQNRKMNKHGVFIRAAGQGGFFGEKVSGGDLFGAPVYLIFS